MNSIINKSKKKNRVVLLKEDYELLTDYLRNYQTMQQKDKDNLQKLVQEINRALVVKKQDFPGDVVRLDSRVTIQDKKTKRIMELRLVLPDQADIKQRKISVLAPIGTALIGFPEGQNVVWEVPAGKKQFSILSVRNNLFN